MVNALLLQNYPKFYKYILRVLFVFYVSTNIACADFSVKRDHSTNLATNNNLQNIKKYYKEGIQQFNCGKVRDAEQLLLLVLKPILSNPENTIIPLEEIDKIKEEVLGSMYYLGLIYLNDTQRVNNYAKAAAIFHYCARFSKKYNCLLSPDFFLEQAYNTEQAILHYYNIYKDDRTILVYKNKIKYYKEKLKNSRLSIANDLYAIDQNSINLEDWSSRIEHVYKKIFNVFINHECSNNNGILQTMITDCQEQIGPVPDGCEYAIVALGSFASGTMTPWSDLEYAIFINKEKEEYKQYFRKLTELLNIKIINIGESNLRWIGVESLNNFASAKEEDDWFWDSISLVGFGLDGKQWYACENPLGRIGYKKKIIASDNSIFFEDREDFELIHTPYIMSMFQSNNQSNNFPIEDPFLVQSLRSVVWVAGSQIIIDEYRKSLQQVVSNNVVQQRITKMLEFIIQKYKIKDQDISDLTKVIDIKEQIYRLVDRLINYTGQYYCILPYYGEHGITSWDVINRLKHNKIISSQEASKLKIALSIATRLRYTVHHNNFDSNNPKAQLAIEEVPNISGINILQQYYIIMLEMQEILIK